MDRHACVGLTPQLLHEAYAEVVNTAGIFQREIEQWSDLSTQSKLLYTAMAEVLAHKLAVPPGAPESEATS